MNCQNTIQLLTLSLLIGITYINNVESAELLHNAKSQNLQYNKDVMLQDFSGKSHKLSEFTGHGKWLIVMIWASDCHVCNAEINNYIKFHNQHKNKNATVMGISVDGWEYKNKAQAFIDKHKVNFPNLIVAPVVADHFYELETGKNLVGTPSFLVYSPSGELKAEQSGAVPTKLIEKFIATQSSQNKEKSGIAK